MKIAPHHLNLDEMIQQRPNSQRIFRLLREMQCYGTKGLEPSRVELPTKVKTLKPGLPLVS